MNIDRTLAALARQMNYLANTAMGDLSKDEADWFHTACDNINQLMELRELNQSIERNTEPPDPPGWEGGFAENH